MDWAASLDEEAPTHAKDLSSRVAIYLVAEDPKEEQETAPLKNYYEEIFKEELAAWTPDEDRWPKTRTLKMFHDWFEAVGESIVTDLESDTIESEER
ncbi:MAG: hypothetical protein HY924_00245 [Elusimicrobia bacterium]|nr:hypothetical protein [Elusimicrobiota bacterium]